MSDKHINTAETVKPVFATSADIASTEKPKVPGCTIIVATHKHPLEPGRTLVYVRGAWADGAYAPMPVALGFAEKLKAVRPGGGGYFRPSPHYRMGHVMDLSGSTDTILAWLAQGKAALEAQVPQVNKPVDSDAPTKKQPVIPTWS